MKEIKLTQGKIAIVDDEDFEYLNQFKWCLNGQGYAVNGKMGYMHRLILNTPKNMQTDHINRNRLDNRRENLRIATASQNQMNKKASGVVPYLGVTPHISRNKHKDKTYISIGYLAKIRHEGKDVYLGRFKTPEEAALAYNKNAPLYHGQFARLNTIPKIKKKKSRKLPELRIIPFSEIF